ncbi:MAG: phospholipid phosphatase, partial [Thermodesulfobacteriota bacterium]
MEIILQWGLDVIRIIQQVQNPLLNSIFLAITSLGSSMSFLLVLPLLFWCVDYNLGVRLTVLCCLSAFCNFFLKDFFSQPRPFE